MDLAFTVDLVTQRFVYPNDLGVGLRQLQVTKGVTYDISLSFVSGLSGASITPSGLGLNICVPNQQNTPLVSLSNISGSAFPVFVASPVLDYAINGQDSILAECDVSFSGNGGFFALDSLSTIVGNNSSLSPQQEYYPLNANPAGYVTTGTLPPGVQSFSYPLSPGSNSYFIPFSPAFQDTPIVTYTLDVPPTGYIYTLATSGVTPSGFAVYLSSAIGASGYALSVMAQG
jgi:hypothetical protein